MKGWNPSAPFSGSSCGDGLSPRRSTSSASPTASLHRESLIRHHASQIPPAVLIL